MADKKVQIVYSIKDKATSALSSLGNKIKKVASYIFSPAGFIAGFAAMSAIIFKTTKLYGVQEDAIKALNTALKNQGKFSEETTKSLQEYAAELQKITTFGDEEIIKAQAIFAQFGLETEQIKKLTEATLDLSVAKGISLASAADLVSKSVGSSTNALTRYGAIIEGAVNSTERVNMAVENMGKLWGGQARAAAQTFTGSISSMQNALGDVGEDIGREFIPMIQGLTETIKKYAETNGQDVVESLKMVFSVVKSVANAFLEAGKFIGEFTFFLSELITKADEFAERFNPFLRIQNSLISLKEHMKGFLTFNQETNDSLVEQQLAVDERLAEIRANKKAREEEERVAEIALEKERTDAKLAKEQEVAAAMVALEASKKAQLKRFENTKTKEDAKRSKGELKGKEQFNKGMSLLSGKFANEETKTALGLAKRVFDIVKNGAAKNIIVQTFQSISRAFAENPFPYSVGVAALMAARGAVQLAGATGVAFADGGVISKPTQALMGEAGTEVVLNQDQMARTLFAIANGQGVLNDEAETEESAQNVTIVLDDGTELAKGIFIKQQELKRTGEING